MSAAFDRKTKIRGIYRRAWKPSVEECERSIINEWYSLCAEVRTAGANTGFAHVLINRLHDLGAMRQRAQRREGAGNV
ncbi:hypothetical protein LC55x_1637 [Lysobacter capsici]|uniref:hypothetical protein n=1 Tax=Lysobacter capsici TaxID=435897 RepID=UPI0007214CBE|nr:hypothetical protein [Lysobacter capsici]ALN84927.1 hypothetical protein LC55x_1637 [Lysobacter capsici]